MSRGAVRYVDVDGAAALSGYSPVTIGHYASRGKLRYEVLRYYCGSRKRVKRMYRVDWFLEDVQRLRRPGRFRAA